MPDNLEHIEPFADVDLDELSDGLISYVRRELNSQFVDYREPLTRLRGGYETLICRFQLSGVEEHLSKPMIIRLFPENKDSSQALRESTIQNTMADLGYPVPSVHASCTDTSVVGNVFVVMDYVEGETLWDSDMSYDRISRVLGNLHARMHQVDPEPIARRFTEMGWDRGSLTFDGKLEWLRTQVDPNYPWLTPAVEWLSENRPSTPEDLSVCHCDFHPLNILFRGGRAQAVLDWGGFLIGDPAMDVAFTTFLITVPLGLLFPDVCPEQVKEKYLSAYHDTKPLDETNMAYYGAARGIQALLDASQGQEAWRIPEMVKLLLVHVQDVTGLRIRPPFYADGGP